MIAVVGKLLDDYESIIKMRKKQRTEIGIGIGDQVESFNRYHLVVCLIEQSIGRSHSEITRTGKV